MLASLLGWNWIWKLRNVKKLEPKNQNAEKKTNSESLKPEFKIVWNYVYFSFCLRRLSLWFLWSPYLWLTKFLGIKWIQWKKSLRNWLKWFGLWTNESNWSNEWKVEFLMTLIKKDRNTKCMYILRCRSKGR